ncbi:chymotrypsin-like elastase family member 1 [Cebidichthys violaceus]|uniref:chymotrypsin-like elastase family member 1 n=1 Tax=Cebidichthys violaceus TaxID=271503 RepID=UPI0035CB1065
MTCPESGCAAVAAVVPAGNSPPPLDPTEEYEEGCYTPDDVILKGRLKNSESLAKLDDSVCLRLSRKARLGKKVQPIQLPNTEVKVKDKSKYRVAGWGFTKTGGEIVKDLRVVDVPIVNLKDCKNKWGHIVENLDNIIRAGGSGTNKGFCQGDSGGPLVCNGKAVGVVSFNYRANCDYPNKPNVYTDVSKYKTWIKKILKQNNC